MKKFEKSIKELFAYGNFCLELEDLKSFVAAADTSFATCESEETATAVLSLKKADNIISKLNEYEISVFQYIKSKFPTSPIVMYLDALINCELEKRAESLSLKR
jgi:hypothetical protein